MLMLKVIIIIAVTASLLMSLWKTLIGLVLPLAILWGYGWLTGFTEVSVVFLIVFSVIHMAFQFTAWRISNTRRDANLAFTGMGVMGFAVGMLASLFFGVLLGFFMWWGLIGRIITEPLALGIKNVVLSFMAGGMKVFYSIIAGGVISFVLF